MTTGKNEGDAPLFFCGWLGIEEGVLAGFEGRNIVQCVNLPMCSFNNLYTASNAEKDTAVYNLQIVF